MSKVVLVTDTHWGARNDSRVFAKYFSRFWNDVFFPYIDEHNIDNVIHLGDIVDRRKYINYVTADSLKKDFINPLKERNIKFWCLIGNHDIYYRNSLEINALDQLYGLNEDINLVTEPQEINIDGCDMLLMPWICKDNWDDSWKSIKYSKSQIMLGHLELNGFEMHRGAICETGFDLGEFSKFDMVLSGHFHHKSSNGNIHLVSSVGVEKIIFLICVTLYAGFALPMFTLNLAYVNDFIDKERFVAAGAGLQIIFGIGAMGGPILCSIFMDNLGSNGFFIYLAIVHTLIGLFGMYRMTKRDYEDNPDSTFTPLPRNITPLGIELDPTTAADLSNADKK